MVSRFDNRRVGVNSTDIYKDLLEERGLKHIRQYFTANLKHPSVEETVQLTSIRHEWSMGDRYFKLAHKYYGDSKLWWVIAHYNQKPTDNHVQLGDVIEIPLPLEMALKVLGY